MTTSDITGTITNGVTLTAANYSNPVTIEVTPVRPPKATPAALSM